jgi:hypothetical protein
MSIFWPFSCIAALQVQGAVLTVQLFFTHFIIVTLHQSSTCSYDCTGGSSLWKLQKCTSKVGLHVCISSWIHTMQILRIHVCIGITHQLSISLQISTQRNNSTLNCLDQDCLACWGDSFQWSTRGRYRADDFEQLSESLHLSLPSVSFSKVCAAGILLCVSCASALIFECLFSWIWFSSWRLTNQVAGWAWFVEYPWDAEHENRSLTNKSKPLYGCSVYMVSCMAQFWRMSKHDWIPERVND